MFKKKIQLTIVYFLPVFILFSLFAWFIADSYNENIAQIDDLIQKIAFNLEETNYINGIENIISPQEWEKLSAAQIDELLITNSIEPIGDPKDPLYFLTPQEIEKKISHEPIFWTETNDQETSDAPQLNYISLEQIQNIQDNISETSITTIITSLFIITVFFGLIAYRFAEKALTPLEEALKKQQRFVSDSSHELRTPLTLMKSEAEILLRDNNATPEEYKNFALNTITDVNRLSSLIDSLLRLAKIDHKNQEIDITEIQLKNQIDIVIKKFATKIKEKKVTIKNNIPEEIIILADKNCFTQILMILLDNAINYCENIIEVSGNVNKKKYTFTIYNDGPEIPMEDISHVFDRFYRVSKDRNKKGYGLGLAIARDLITLQKGYIDIKAKNGTIVSCTFPEK